MFFLIDALNKLMSTPATTAPKLTKGQAVAAARREYKEALARNAPAEEIAAKKAAISAIFKAEIATKEPAKPAEKDGEK